MKGWDEELLRLAEGARHHATHHQAIAVIGVAVDDERKRDYFVPRLQALVDSNTWAQCLTFRVIPVMGGEVVEVTATTGLH